MTERERWIVYPLLFLALGAALRDKIAKQTQTREIVCERLLVVDSEGRSVAALIGDSSQLSRRDQALLADMRRSNSRLAVGDVLANVVDAESLFSLNQPVRPTGAPAGTIPNFRTLGDLLRYLQQSGVAITGQGAVPDPPVEPSRAEPLGPIPPAFAVPQAQENQSSGQDAPPPSEEAASEQATSEEATSE
ncbi:hypothetical protein [Botrimarina hoheduenensis]|uniref:Uncharacterized protein n=1 Tax=Botrimarina hoheduenensis TaxID=2528000 RepID=A0A5C5W104_9BACT|nr:hypothetical protein [Botrimarina hoheduenensis]TWT43452.1 hypothetical protein Pla111_24030 [Botrimarina hoheduenensis]